MKTFIQNGDNIDFTAPAGGVVGGVPVKIGGFIAIPVNSAAATERFVGQVTGCHRLPKATGTAWTEGAKIYWDDTAKAMTTVVSTNTLCGLAIYAAASGDTEGDMLLTVQA